MATEFHKRSLTTSKILWKIVLHTSTFDQNSFHPAPGMAAVSKEAKLHDKLENVKNNMSIEDF